MGTGQFCTNPGLVILQKSDISDAFVKTVTEKFSAAALRHTFITSSRKKPCLQVFNNYVILALSLLTGGGESGKRSLCTMPIHLMMTTAACISRITPQGFQTEAFGNAALIVIADDVLANVCGNQSSGR